MAVYRLMDGLSGRPGNGPGSPAAYSGNFTAGIIWKVTSGGLWLPGYYHWVPTGGDTVARKFALWQLTDNSHGVNQALVPASTVTSGTMTANAWNFVPLAVPIALSGNVPYVAAAGWVAVNGFPDTQGQFGSGDPYSAGIVNGPVAAYSDQGGSAPEPFTSNYHQGLFGTSTADPSSVMPALGDVASNFWVDIQVSDSAPAGASYRLWPSQPYAVNWAADTANNFTLGTEFSLSGPCALDRIWFYSPAGVTQLPTECGVWDILSQSLVSGTHNASPSWSGAAGSGWVSCDYTSSGVTLSGARKYKVSVYNGAGSPAVWNAETSNYWATGPGGSGIANGPVSAPSLAAATSPGQSTYHQGTPFSYPDTYSSVADGANYWVDAEVTPVTPAGLVPPLVSQFSGLY